MPNFPFDSVKGVAVAGLGEDGKLGPETSARVEGLAFHHARQGTGSFRDLCR